MASAVDTGSSRTATSPSAGPQESVKSQSVAYEAQVIATGTRPGANAGQRELFTEATSTVLIYENGGVIRLSAAVAPGQLLYLTNQQSKREVVTQVKHKRSYRPTSCYVELEFTEPAPGFWGIEFPATVELTPANAQLEAAAELVQSAEVTADDPVTPAPAPGAHEVEALKQEVESFGQQVKLLKTQAEPATSSVPMAPTCPPSPILPAAVPGAPSPSGTTELRPPVRESAPVAPKAASSLPIEASAARPKPTVPKREPLSKPTPGLKKTGESAKRPAKTQRKEAADPRSGPFLIVLVCVVFLLAATGTAWYKHRLPDLPRLEEMIARGSAMLAHPANSPAPARPAAENAASSHSDSGNITAAGSAPPPQPSGASLDASQPAAAEPTPPSGSAPHAAAADKPASANSALKRLVVHPSKTAIPDSPDPSSDESGIVPPKLLKSARAVPPREAVSGFVTGNVVLDAVVDPSGRVNSIKVLSGPAILRKAAMEALEQYRYEPALQNGKPVSAHVTVTVQFWYEP